MGKAKHSSFKIITVSVDHNPDTWKKAVSEDGIHQFVNLLLPKEQNRSFHELYNILAVPKKC